MYFFSRTSNTQLEESDIVVPTKQSRSFINEKQDLPIDPIKHAPMMEVEISGKKMNKNDLNEIIINDINSRIE